MIMFNIIRHESGSEIAIRSDDLAMEVLAVRLTSAYRCHKFARSLHA
jgi:hypothetical protein